MLTDTLKPGGQRGTSLLEVLITLVILAFGLLGLVGLQSKMHLALGESYQRAQAVVLLTDMVERIKTNQTNAASYVSANTLGTGDSEPTDCIANATFGAARDLCEWSNELKGAAEQKTTTGTATATNMGAMDGARGCITQIQAQDITTCTPAIYQVAVAWQGLHKTTAPSVTCGQNDYGSDDGYRRTVSMQVSVGLPSCVSN